MKIAFYSDTFLPQVNGVVRSLVALAETLRDRGHEIEIHTTSDPNPAGLAGCRVVRYPSFTLPNYPQYRVMIPTFRRWRTIQKRPDVIHSHTSFGVGWEAVAAAKHLKCPLVGTHHTLAEKYGAYMPFVSRQRGREIALRYAAAYYRRCDAVITSSQALADELKAGGLTQPVTWISNPLAIERFVGSAPKTELKTRFGLSDPSLLYHGRIAAENRLELLLEAMAEVKKVAPGVILAVAGDGPIMPKLKQLAARLKLDAAVKFTGMLHNQELVDLVMASDMFVSPSDSENQSMALLEAMAAGLAIVATRGGGTPEHVQERKNALLAEPGDRASLVRGVLALVKEPELCAHFGVVSKNLAQRFDRHRVAEELERIYDRLSQSRCRE